MKKTFFFLTMCLFVLASCSKSETDTVVAILKDNVNTKYWRQVAVGVNTASLETRINNVICYTSEDGSADEQIDFIKKAMAIKSLKGIVIAPCNKDVADAAALAGVPVVVVDSPVDPASPLSNSMLSFIATDNENAGMLVGGRITEPGSNVLIVHLASSTAIDSRVKGFQKVKPDAYDMLVEDGDCSAQISEYLAAHPEVNTIFAANGSTARFTLKATESTPSQYSIYAFDTISEIISAIRSGRIVGTMAQDTFGMGYYGVRAFYEPSIRGTKYLDTYFVDKNNIDSDEAKRYVNAVD